MKRWHATWHWLLLIPLALGLARLRLDTEVLDLLPEQLRSVQGVKLYQRHFSNARELILTVTAPDRELATQTAQALAEHLRQHPALVSEVVWQPPWLEHPEQTAELIAHLWFNQPPARFRALAEQLAVTNLAAVLNATREELATTLSPTEIARLSYDPFGLTRLPEAVGQGAPGLDQADRLFSSKDGTFRILFIQSKLDLPGYRECTAWLEAVRKICAPAVPAGVRIGLTGRPAFVAEIAASMRGDITASVLGTAAIIALLFWCAHRRWRPLVWLLTLLGLILGATLALGGLVFGEIHIISMGFAAILLGLAVDYAVVHYQEALAHPDLTVPQIRRAIAPSIFWAATTTIAAFLVLNLGGLPGLGQLGTLVAMGVALSAFLMVYAYLPPLFPDRMRASAAMRAGPGAGPQPPSMRVSQTNGVHQGLPSDWLSRLNPVLTWAVVLAAAMLLARGWPALEGNARALEPRYSQAYVALEAMKKQLSQDRDPLWLVLRGVNEEEVARRLDAVQPVLQAAVSNGVLTGFQLPTVLWPRPENQQANRATADGLVAEREALHEAAREAGFSSEAMGLTDGLLNSWHAMSRSSRVYWPSNTLCAWVMSKLAVREGSQLLAVGFLFPAARATDTSVWRNLEKQWPADGIWLAGWELLGGDVLQVVRRRMWLLVLPMVGLVLLALWVAFRRWSEIGLSLIALTLSGWVVLGVMSACGWSWNLLNLMAVPLVLGTGVDYGIFMQFALRRHGGDSRMAHRSVGRALLLCGGTAAAGFAMLGWSSNAGMASLGRVCAVGITANMLIAIYLLPGWWQRWARDGSFQPSVRPSSLYGARLWQWGLQIARRLPPRPLAALAWLIGLLYWAGARHRRQTVTANLRPVLGPQAARAARRLFSEFAMKIVDLWRYEAGIDVTGLKTDWQGWEKFAAAHGRGKGVLIVTPHLGNWELGAAFFVKHDVPLLVLTQAEPDARLTEMRQASRARRGVETLVVGEDPFAFVEIIKRLQAGATVALLVDRPPAATAVLVQMFGQSFPASIAAAELARASGCAIVPGYIVRHGPGYAARFLDEIPYDRASIGRRDGRIRLTQEILLVFAPIIREFSDQWYHFVPVWPDPSAQLPLHPHASQPNHSA